MTSDREYQDCCVTADTRLEFIEDLTANIRLCLKCHVRGIRRPFDVILLRVRSLDVFDSIFNAGRGLVRNLPLEEDAFKACDFPQEYATYFAGWAINDSAHVTHLIIVAPQMECASDIHC